MKAAVAYPRPEALQRHSRQAAPSSWIVEGGAGENAETEESWMESPSHQPCLTID